MNKNIEDIIKEALDNHDSGYVTGAWEKMSARLDGTTPTPFYKKWWIAAAFGTVLVGSAAYFLSTENDVKSSEKLPVATTVQSNTGTVDDNSDKQRSSVKEAHLAHNPTSGNDAIDRNNVNPSQNKISGSGSGNASCSGAPSGGQANGNMPSGNAGNPIPDNKINNPNTVNSGNDTYKKMVLPVDICANEEIIIGNPNSAKFITVTDINGKTYDLAPGKKLTLTPKAQGTITVQSGDHKDLVSVHENSAKPYIDFDASLLYENGIPTIKFKTQGVKDNLVWSSNIKGTEQKGETYIVHPYSEKSVEVRVTSSNEFGCEVSETQRIDVKEYNLLAPTGFRPNSGDIQTNTFMPYALTQRNVNFELVVIDPRNGGVVFSTTDATQGWDGIDRRTGEMVNAGSVWAWKVVMKNPNVGEPSEYKGSITRM